MRGENAKAESSGGAERYYFNLLGALPACGVTGPGTIVGAQEAPGDATIISFAAAQSGPLTRWSGLRRSVRWGPDRLRTSNGV
jgi:hypothetical protein